MSIVELVWVTPEAERLVLEMARVSSGDPKSKDTKLLSYLIKHAHWSPFEMVNMCVKIETTRAISSQLLRHRSFSFQEYSQRYATVNSFEIGNARRQDFKNRQNSTDDLSEDTIAWWEEYSQYAVEAARNLYISALAKGIAKECARSILPMCASTTVYMNGSLRSWIHYLQLRCSESTQLEHRIIANEIHTLFTQQFPLIAQALP